jgi:hypothetical protein
MVPLVGAISEPALQALVQPVQVAQSQLSPQSTWGVSAPVLHFASQRSSPHRRVASLQTASAAQFRTQGPLAQATVVPLQACLPVHTRSQGNSAGHATEDFSHALSPVQATWQAMLGGQIKTASLQAALLAHSM